MSTGKSQFSTISHWSALADCENPQPNNLENSPAPELIDELEIPDETVESTSATDEEPLVPRFDENRHEGVKLFVTIWAIGTLIWIILQGLWKIPRQYHRFKCEAFFDKEKCAGVGPMNLWEGATVFYRYSMEVLFPFMVLVMLVFCQLMINAFPGVAMRIGNPIRNILSMVYVTCTFYMITDFFTAATMLTNVTMTKQFSIQIEYVLANASALYWMFSLLNLMSFSKLTTFNHIRARERWQMEQPRQQENV